jgi:hypothetical protein
MTISEVPVSATTYAVQSQSLRSTTKVGSLEDCFSQGAEAAGYVGARVGYEHLEESEWKMLKEKIETQNHGCFPDNK